MAQDNVEVVRRMYEAFGRGDIDAVRRAFDPDVMIDATHRVDGRIGHGREELIAIVSEWLGAWDEWHEEIEEMRDVGGRVLVVSTQSGHGKGSGIAWENRFGMLFDVANDRITRWTVYDDVGEALGAAGLDR
jgi:uncharacterized protein